MIYLLAHVSTIILTKNVYKFAMMKKMNNYLALVLYFSLLLYPIAGKSQSPHNNNFTIKGKVFIDKNHNNIFDQEEQIVKGAVVILKNENGKEISSFTIAENEEYFFEKLDKSKTYRVYFQIPEVFFTPEYGANSAMSFERIFKHGSTQSLDFILKPIIR